MQLERMNRTRMEAEAGAKWDEQGRAVLETAILARQ